MGPRPTPRPARARSRATIISAGSVFAICACGGGCRARLDGCIDGGAAATNDVSIPTPRTGAPSGHLAAS
jgi:hypothetical protein